MASSKQYLIIEKVRSASKPDQKIIITDSLGVGKISQNIRLNENVTKYVLHFCFNKYSSQFQNNESLFFEKLNKYLSDMGVNLDKNSSILLSPWTLNIEANVVRDKHHRGTDKTNQAIDKSNKSKREFYENELYRFIKEYSFSTSGIQQEAYHRRSFFGLLEQIWKFTPQELKQKLTENGFSDPWKEGVDLETLPVIAYKGNQRYNPRANETEKRIRTYNSSHDTICKSKKEDDDEEEIKEEKSSKIILQHIECDEDW